MNVLQMPKTGRIVDGCVEVVDWVVCIEDDGGRIVRRQTAASRDEVRRLMEEWKREVQEKGIV